MDENKVKSGSILDIPENQNKQDASDKLIEVPDGGFSPFSNVRIPSIPDGGHKVNSNEDLINIPESQGSQSFKNFVVSNTFVSFVISSDNIHKIPVACAPQVLSKMS